MFRRSFPVIFLNHILMFEVAAKSQYRAIYPGDVAKTKFNME